MLWPGALSSRACFICLRSRRFCSRMHGIAAHAELKVDQPPFVLRGVLRAALPECSSVGSPIQRRIEHGRCDRCRRSPSLRPARRRGSVCATWECPRSPKFRRIRDRAVMTSRGSWIGVADPRSGFGVRFHAGLARRSVETRWILIGAMERTICRYRSSIRETSTEWIVGLA